MRHDKKVKRKNSKQFNRKFRKRFLTRKSMIIIAFTVIIFMGLGLGYYKIEQRVNAYQETIDELALEIDELKSTNESLEKEMEGLSSDEYIEKMARERLGMVKKGEHILKQSKNSSSDDNDDK